MPDVGAFLLGAPKSGTTWLAGALEQHPGICVSNPKEPNEIASHKGTFDRDDRLPDWERYSSCFNGEGVKLDCSVHALACPLAPSRVLQWWPEARFIVCLREPVSRTISHWNMVLDTKEVTDYGVDWTVFGDAWQDERLSLETLYGASLSRWFNLFSDDRFLLIESSRMRNDPEAVLKEVVGHLGLPMFDFDLGSVHNANTAADRRPITLFGKVFKGIVAVIPGIIKRPIVKSLQGRGINVYKLPLLSRKRKEREVPSELDLAPLKADVLADLVVLEEVTGFDASTWIVGLQ